MSSKSTPLAAPLQPIHRPWTAPQLFAGVGPTGSETCFYCCGSCEPIHSASAVVKKSFTGLDSVSLSDWVCPGCIAAMHESATIRMIDGEIREKQKIRGYSWIFTETRKFAATKSHRSLILSACLVPPEPPFVICISDSGQKHLLYRAVVNASRDLVTVTLEGEAVTYRPADLMRRIELCKRVAAATGKPAMKDLMSPQSQMRIVEHFESDEVLAAWLGCDSEPFTRLAAWLCPPKAECEIEYPAIAGGNANDQHRATQAAFSWSD